jgi:hypothetical protein
MALADFLIPDGLIVPELDIFPNPCLSIGQTGSQSR